MEPAPLPGAAGEPLPPAGDDGVASPAGGKGLPPHLQALMDSIERSGPSSTANLVAALAPLAQYGLSPEQAALVGFGRFPVAGEASYVHDWWYPRFGPGWRLHQGTDIFAARGTPVRAPAEGTVRITSGGLGGLAVYVTEADRTYYYLAHLAGIAPGLADGATVAAGQVVGYVGDSGNARGGSPHVHFEIHPGGGAAVDPKAVLDQYLTHAEAAAPRVLAAYAEAQPDPGADGATGGPTPPVLPEPAEVDVRAVVAASENLRSTMLWATTTNPGAGALQLAQSEALRAGGQVDWDHQWALQQASRRARGEADRRVEVWLSPLVPPALGSAIR